MPITRTIYTYTCGSKSSPASRTLEARLAHMVRTSLSRAKLRTDNLRAQVYNISGYQQELVAWCFGLSGRITKTIARLRFIRGIIAVRSHCGIPILQTR